MTTTTLQQAVQRVLQHVFVKQNRGLKKLKLIKKCITQHAAEPAIVQLFQKHDPAAIYMTTQRMLVQGAFACETTDSAIPVEPHAVIDQVTGEVVGEKEHDQDYSYSAVDLKGDKSQSATDNKPPLPDQLDSLHFPTQDLLMRRIQTILEQACFDYAQQHMPEILQKRRWDCAQALELNGWCAVLQQHPKAAVVSAQLLSSQALLISLAQLRHVTVHRQPLSLVAIKQFMLAAQSFVLDIENTEALELLHDLYRSTMAAIRELDGIQKQAQVRVSQIEQQLKVKHSALEMAASAQRVIECAENDKRRNLVGENLEKVIIDAMPFRPRRWHAERSSSSSSSSSLIAQFDPTTLHCRYLPCYAGRRTCLLPEQTVGHG